MGMNVTRRATWITLSVVMLCGSPARGEETTGPSPMRRMVDTMNPTNWKMPTFLKMPKFSGIMPAKQDQMRIKKKKDGLVADVSQTASRSWQRTKETLSPQNLNPIKFFPASARTPSKPKADSGPGFFGSLFAPRPQPESPNTVNGFLGQAKPRG